MTRRSRDREKRSGEPARLRLVIGSPWFWPAVIAALALTLRLTYIFQIRYTPFFQTLGRDASIYDAWARGILIGAADREAYFMSPLYPYFLAGVYRLFTKDLMLVRVIQAILSSGTAVLISSIASGIFGRRVGILAGLGAATYGAFIFYDGSLLPASLLVLLSVLFLFLLLRADRTDVSRWYLLAGVTLGVAAIGKPTILAVAPVAAVWLATVARSRGSGRRGAGRPTWLRLRGVALLALGVILVVAPVTVRNYVVSRDFVPVTSNGGLNFYIGNSEMSTGGSIKPEGIERTTDVRADIDGRAYAEEQLGRPLKPSEISGFWYGKARRYIVSAPGDWLRLMLRKTVFALSAYELPQLEYYDFQKRYSPLLSLPLPSFALVAPLGILGAFLSLRRRRAVLLTLFCVTHLVTMIAFFVLARYRLPAVPVFLIMAAFAVVEVVSLVRRRAWATLGWGGAVLAAAAVLVNSNPYDVDRYKAYAQPHFRLGIVYGDRGETDRAIEEYRKSIALDATYEKSYLNLGALLSERGDLVEAGEMFRRAVRLEPRYVAARMNLAMVYEEQGAYDEALAEVDTALALSPRQARVLKERGIILYRMGRTGEAEAAFRDALEADTDGAERSEIEFYLGRIRRPAGAEPSDEVRREVAEADLLWREGRVVDALEKLERARVLAPEWGEPLRRIAFIKGDMGLAEEAVELMRLALRVDPMLEHGHYGLGVLLGDLGMHDEAIREYEAELSLNPRYAPAHLNLGVSYAFHAGNPNKAAYHYRRYIELGGPDRETAESLLNQLRLGPAGGQ